VAPLLWLPGVLRSQGPWATVMKETQEGTAYGLSQGVDLIKPDDEIPLSKSSGPDLQQQLRQRDMLIGEMERALAKQKYACEQVQRGTRALERTFLRQIDEARRQEKTRHEKEIELKLQPLREQLSDVKEEYSTLRKAHKVRVQKAYAQDNFISQYSKALSSVKQQARDIANKEQSQLRNKVGALERRLTRDTEFKLALKKRTETAEEIAEKKFRDAENKIPKLESQLLHSQIELEQAKRTLKSKMYHFSRAAKDHEGRVKKDQEDVRRLAKENEELKQQVSLCGV
jgi:DNA repair exonuclease SbcCD ATPase subunit